MGEESVWREWKKSQGGPELPRSTTNTCQRCGAWNCTRCDTICAVCAKANWNT